MLFGLLAVFAVGLLIYFLKRVRKSEKEAEDDWGLSSRGILLAPTTLAEAGAAKKSGTQVERVPPPKEPELPVISASEPESQLIAEMPGPPEPEVATETPAQIDLIEAAEIVPAPLSQPLTDLSQEHESVSWPEPQSGHAEPASPFDEEIWSQLESPQQHTAGEPGFVAPAPMLTGPKEPYEPPRIDPIVPRQEQGQQRQVPVPSSRPASASQQSPVNPARLEARGPASKSSKPVPAPAGSILGLPAEASPGPFIIDRSKGREDAAAVGTLANYDKAPDDAAGHAGTIALMIVIIMICAGLGAYIAIPSAHTGIDNLVARVRGIKEPPKPVAQIFPSTLDETKDPAVAKGALQNISDQALSGLVVTVSLEPRGGGAATTQDVQVTPDEISPGQQGTYEFQIETKKYQKYKVAGLKSRDGITLAYVKPNQQQQ